jgi:hypothetical protein
MNLAAATGQTVEVSPDATYDFGTVTLVEVGDTLARHTVYLVIPDARAAKAWGVPGREGTVIGGIVRDRSRWAATAYGDRADMLDNTHPVYYLPVATSRAAAARGLLRWWNRVTVVGMDTPSYDVRWLDPMNLPARERRLLVA